MKDKESVFNLFPVIDLDDIILREIVLEDVKDFFNYVTDKRVNRFIAEDDIPKNLASAETELMYWADLFKYRRSIYWGIAKKKNNVLIGTCGYNIWSRTHSRGEISYDLSYSHWGKGIMTRCVKAICDFGFGVMGVNRIQATVALDNHPSMKVLTKNHFQKEGIMRNYGVLQGQKKDFYMYSLIKEDMVF